MTSISSSYSVQQRLSPREMMQDRLSDAVTSGSVKASDKDALASALDDIDQSLSSSQGTSGTSRPDPKAMKEKIDGLIDAEVTSGKLTSDQAGELKQLFAKGSSGGQGGPGGAGGPGGGQGGPGGPGGAGGPPPQQSGASESDTDSDGTTTSKLLSDFLKLLQEKQSTTSGYGAGGSQDLQSVLSSLLVDTSA
jgi:hypothetical protein